MTIDQTQTEEQLTQADAVALTTKLAAWMTQLEPREQHLLAVALSRVATGQDEVHGHGGAGGDVVMRSGLLADVVSRLIAPQGGPAGVNPSRGRPSVASAAAAAGSISLAGSASGAASDISR